MRTLIIGYGNPLRGDDGLGWRVAEELARTPAFSEAKIILRHQLTPDLAEDVSQADRVLFIDAAQDIPPGEVKCQALSGDTPPIRLAHHYSPDQLLGLARALYGATIPGHLFRIGGENFGLSEHISPHIAGCLPRLIALIADAQLQA